MDSDWRILSEKMNLPKSFIEQYADNIIGFLAKNGAEMTRIYYDFTTHKKAYFKIIQAELMGELSRLKYYPNDLKKELSYIITKDQQNWWMKK